MKWIKTNKSALINLDMIICIGIGKKRYRRRHKVIYIFPDDKVFNEYFDTEQEAKDRLEELRHIIGIAGLKE